MDGRQAAAGRGSAEEMTEPTPLSKAARNEQRKLQATSWNAIGLAFVAVGFVQPVVAGELTVIGALKVVVASVIGYMFHQYAVRLLRRLED
jgi:hypothetical protein